MSFLQKDTAQDGLQLTKPFAQLVSFSVTSSELLQSIYHLNTTPLGSIGVKLLRVKESLYLSSPSDSSVFLIISWTSLATELKKSLRTLNSEA